MTLITAHGLIGSLGYYDPASRIRNASVHAVDLLGYGTQRQVGLEHLTIQRQSEYLAEVIVEIGAGPVWILAHSMGGAVAVLLADQRPELVAGIVNVEGNFVVSDAFWSSSISKKSLEEWENEYAVWLADVPAWVRWCRVDPTPLRVDWAREILLNQPPSTVYHMAKALVRETSCPSYLEAVRRLVDRELPMHLIAGARSEDGWGVPDFVRLAAQSYTVQQGAGHLMMFESPDEFCRIVDDIFLQGSTGP